MKKLLSLFVVAILGVSAAFAQCTPDPQYTSPGIYPDSATGLAGGMVGTAYSQVITAVVPLDTVYNNVPIQVDSIRVKEVAYIDNGTWTPGLPPGLNYQCSDPLCTFDGGSSGCIVLNGTPTQHGTFPIRVVTTTYAFLVVVITQADTVDDYSIVIEPVGVAEILNNKKFDVAQNIPNPFNNSTVINYSSPTAKEIEFTVYDVLGKVVHHRKFMSEAGINKIHFDTESHAPGMYMYTVSNGEQAITKRMMIAK